MSIGLLRNMCLNFKFLRKNPLIILALVIILILAISCGIFILPFYVIGPFIFESPIILTSGIIFSSIYFNWNESNLSNNSSITKNSKFSCFLALFITIFIIVFIEMNLLILILSILSKYNILYSQWNFRNEEGYSFALFHWIPMYYSIIWINIIMFLILYIFKTFLKTRKSLYIFVFILLLISLIFGSSLNNYFHDNPKKGLYNLIFGEFLFPKQMFSVSLLFPIYAPGQIMSIVFECLRTHSNGNQWSSWRRYLEHWNILQWMPINSVLGINAITWDLVLITPAIWTLVLLIITFFTSKLEGKKQ